MVIQILLTFCFLLPAHADWNGKILDVRTKQNISRTELISNLSLNNIIVIGEKHYTKEVQDEEGKLISDVVIFSNKENQFSLFWEFLNASSQNETQALLNQVITHEISASDFLIKTQGSAKAVIYSPMIEAAVNLGGNVFGGNLSRDEKAPVVSGGLAALDPKLLPPGFKLGGPSYLERFTEVMSGHATPEQITNYFAAQSLVDDSIAYHLYQNSMTNLNFLVIGAFHSMYSDGVVSRLRDRNSSSKIANIEIIDCSDYTIQEMEDLDLNDKYGDRADFIVFVNEPEIVKKINLNK
jgi:uncharacterized iron-regulated protein